MPARDLDQLAAQLGRPSTGLAPFAHLEPDQIALLSEAIEATRVRRQDAVESALAGVVPPAARRRPGGAARRLPGCDEPARRPGGARQALETLELARRPRVPAALPARAAARAAHRDLRDAVREDRELFERLARVMRRCRGGGAAACAPGRSSRPASPPSCRPGASSDSAAAAALVRRRRGRAPGPQRGDASGAWTVHEELVREDWITPAGSPSSCPTVIRARGPIEDEAACSGCSHRDQAGPPRRDAARRAPRAPDPPRRRGRGAAAVPVAAGPRQLRDQAQLGDIAAAQGEEVLSATCGRARARVLATSPVVPLSRRAAPVVAMALRDPESRPDPRGRRHGLWGSCCR